MKTLIIIAHGSKKDSSNNEFLSMVERIKQKDNKNYNLIEAAFLEIATPDIKSTIEKLISKGASQIYFYPFFLNSGKHVIIDIPEIIKEVKDNNPNIKFELLEHFGASTNIDTIILDDIKQI